MVQPFDDQHGHANQETTRTFDQHSEISEQRENLFGTHKKTSKAEKFFIF